MSQRDMRRATLMLLAGLDICGRWTKEYVHWRPLLLELYPQVTLDHFEPMDARVSGIQQKLSGLDEEIQRVSPRWKVSRMATIDRNLLRLGIFEILHLSQTPAEVINDCIELGKEYGEATTPAFVNGLLDQIRRDHKH